MAEENIKVKSKYYTTNNPQPETQPDWTQNDSTAPDYIKNRIGGYYTNYDATTITWDGDITGRDTINLDSYNLYKVSDIIIHEQDVIGAVITITDGQRSQEITLTSDDLTNDENLVMSDVFISCGKSGQFTTDLFGEEITFFVPSPGTYFPKLDNQYVKSILKPATTVLTQIPAELTTIKGGYDIQKKYYNNS